MTVSDNESMKTTKIHLVLAVTAVLALAALLGCSQQNTYSPQTRDGNEAIGESMQYTIDTKIADVSSDLAFDGYGRLLFPVDEGYMHGLTLGDIQLAWYSFIDPSETVAEGWIDNAVRFWQEAIEAQG